MSSYLAEVEKLQALQARQRELWEKAPTIQRFLGEMLAAQGDHADRELIDFQHWLTELLRSPANIPTP